MKTKLLSVLTAVILLLIPTLNFAQAPPLGTAADFVLFSSVGAVTNVGTYKYLTHLTGNVGTNSGSSTNFGNVNGVMHDGDGASGQCAIDLLSAYNSLSAAIPTDTLLNPVIGNDTTLNAGIYFIPGDASLNLGLTLNAEGNPDAVFIFKTPTAVAYAFTANPNSKIHLINGAKACNVFWQVSGAVNMEAGVTMRGSILSGGAISMGAQDTLEGRALTVNGAITVSNGALGFLAYTPIGCGSPVLNGPAALVFVGLDSYAIFATTGAVSDDGTSHITGDVGGNTVAPTGFNPDSITGTIHFNDPSTIAAAADLLLNYNSLLALPYDIELMDPSEFGHNLVLTPHTYMLNAATTLTDTLYLDALGNADAVFIIKMYGAFNTLPNSKVLLINGTQAKNVFWFCTAAVSVTPNSEFIGAIIAHDAIEILPGTRLNGRAFSTNGAITTSGINATIPPTIPFLITSEPTNQTACVGDSVSFSVTATGTSLAYQWRKGTIDLIDGGNISGATTDMLTINPVSFADTASNYNVVITGGSPPSVINSIDVSLVIDSPNIITEPANKTACAGDSISFSVTSTGTGLVYQWKKGDLILIDGANIFGATSATLSIDPVTFADTASNYHVVITGQCPPKDSSLNVSLIIDNPNIITEPIDKTACAGDSISFSVTSTGTGLVYQWKKGNLILVDGPNIFGATSATLSIDPVTFADTASNYHVVIAGTCLPNDSSINVSLEIDNPNIITEPNNKTACAGDSVSFSVTATGTGLTYQWKKGDLILTNGGRIFGATSATLSIDPVIFADTATDYHVVITGTCLPNATSIDVSLAVDSAVIITTQPMSQIVCAGSIVNFSVATTGTGLTYQWRKGTIDLIDGGNISGVTSALLTIDPVYVFNTASDYNVVISGTCSQDVISDNASLEVDSTVIITSQPANQTACVGSPVNFSVSATGSGISYQWRKGNVMLVNGGNISGATTAMLTIDPVNISDAANDYNVVITGICSPNVISDNASLNVNTAPEIISQPASQTACVGSPANFSVSATGSGTSYQWRKGEVILVNGGNISGATTAMLTIDPVNISDAATDYNVVITGICSPNVISENASLNVNTAPEIISQPANQTACVGSPVNFSVSATGSGISYQWRKGTTNLVNGGNISGATTAMLTIDPVNISDAATDYNVVITGTCSLEVLISNNVSLIVDTAPNITSQSENQTLCAGGSVSFSVNATGNNLTYQWRKGNVVLINGANISGANTAMLTFDPVFITDAASDYNVVITGTCSPDATSNNVSLIVNSAIDITTEPTNQITCEGSSVSFSVAATGTVLTYQWRKGEEILVNGENIYGATTATLTFYPVKVSDSASNYNVVITGACTPISTSFEASLSVCDLGGIPSFEVTNKAVTVYPNPFTTSIIITINDVSLISNCELRIYNVMGKEVRNTNLTKELTNLEVSYLPAGIYFYRIIGKNKLIQSGKLVSQQ